MIRMYALLAISALSAVGFGGRALGQPPPPVILAVDLENIVVYEDETGDPTKFARDPGKPAANNTVNFTRVIWLADVVAVNGAPVKGTWTVSGVILGRSTNAAPGTAIADSGASLFFDWAFDILQPDGTPIGTIMATGWGGAARPPGAPSSFLQANMTVTGGTGAFLGVRGQAGQGGNTIAPRFASMREDPANRRTNGGGKRRYVFHLFPMVRPEVVQTANGAALFHGDFTPVTAANPAKPGEMLIAQATGLGPTRPGVDPGIPFPQNPLQEVNSPVEIFVNGKPAQLVNKIGWPGLVDTYRVDFEVPEGTPPGAATLQITAAWISGSQAQFMVR